MIKLACFLVLFFGSLVAMGQEPPTQEVPPEPPTGAAQSSDGQEQNQNADSAQGQPPKAQEATQAAQQAGSNEEAPAPDIAQPKGAPVSAKDILNPFKDDLNLVDTNELRKELVREFLPVYEYGAEGRKDPFAQPVVEKPLEPLPIHGPVLPLQTVNLDQIQVKAILWNVAKPKAIIQLPDGNIITVKLKDRLGNRNGYVAAIREGEVILVETVEEQGKVFSNTRILTLNQ